MSGHSSARPATAPALWSGRACFLSEVPRLRDPSSMRLAPIAGPRLYLFAWVCKPQHLQLQLQTQHHTCEVFVVDVSAVARGARSALPEMSYEGAAFSC
mmetsp:Transcript_13809/g.44728  ORF Transcript_13809/g.44728 Transcript_13809/m.44728 type:complete len:99 (-) Transcript_13809:33-329(-)